MPDLVSCPTTSAPFVVNSMSGYEVLLGLVMGCLAAIGVWHSIVKFAEAGKKFRRAISHNDMLSKGQDGDNSVPIGEIVWAAFHRRDAKRAYAEARSELYLEGAALLAFGGLGVWLAVQAYQLPPNYLECQHTLQALMFRSITRVVLLSSLGGFIAYLIQLHKDAQREVQIHTQLRVTADAQRLIHMAIRPGGEYSVNDDGTLTERTKLFVATVLELTRVNVAVYAPPGKAGKDDPPKEAKDGSDTSLQAQEMLATVSKMAMDIGKFGVQVGGLHVKLAEGSGKPVDLGSSGI